MLALVFNFWDAFDSKLEMPVVPTMPEVYFRDWEGRVWDLSSQLLSRFDPTAYKWDTCRPSPVFGLGRGLASMRAGSPVSRPAARAAAAAT